MTDDLEFSDCDDAEIEFVEPPEWMTARELLTLHAIGEITAITKRPTFQSKMNWPLHRRLARNGFIVWDKKHPEFGPGFASVGLTEKGAYLLSHVMPVGAGRKEGEVG